MILIIGKNFGDMDRLIPLAYYFKHKKNEEVEVCVANETYIDSNDFRLDYLRDAHNIPVENFYNSIPGAKLKKNLLLLKGYWFKHLASRLLLRAIQTVAGTKARESVTKKITQMFATMLGDSYGLQDWIDYLKAKNPKVIVIDNRPRPIPLLEAAKALDIPVIAMPHGMETIHETFIGDKEYYHDIVDVKKSEVSTRCSKENQDFDPAWDISPEGFCFPHEYYTKIITQFAFEKERYTLFNTPEDKVAYLGDPRFCPEWCEIYNTLIPPASARLPEAKPGRVKVVFMDHKSQTQMRPKEVIESMKQILSLGFIDMVIKPSTGSVNQHSLKNVDNYFTEGLDKFCQIENDEHSNRLIEWADVVIVSRSSIWIEVSLRGKTLMHPSFWQDVTSVTETLNGSWHVHSTEEMVEAFKKLRDDPTYRPYSDEEEKTLLDFVAFGGDGNRNVLEDHYQFIMAEAKDR